LSEYSWLFGEGKRSTAAAATRPSDPSSTPTGSPGSLGEAMDEVFKQHSNLFGEEKG